MEKNQRFVAHIDILGMSALVAKDPELSWQLLSGLAQARNGVTKLELTFLDTAERIAVPDRIHCVTFSDTIVLFTLSDELVDLRSIIIVTTELLNKALNLSVPVRAGIALGTFFVNFAESMYAGPALIEAYHLGEQTQWIGIVTSEAVYSRAKAAGLQSGTSDVVVRCFIPVEGGTRDGFAVNWPAVMRRNITAPLPVSPQQVYEGFAQYFGPYSDLTQNVRTKYEHTAWFINQMSQEA